MSLSISIHHKLTGPRTLITDDEFIIGTVMTLMGLVQNYEGLLAARFFLGMTESGLCKYMFAGPLPQIELLTP